VFNKLGVVALSLLVVSCGSSDKVASIVPMQSKDKSLTCTEILLEMNDAKFQGNIAKKKKNAKLSSIIMPLGYVSDYLDAEEKIGLSQDRISYLEGIYDIHKCDERKNDVNQANQDEMRYSPVNTPRYEPQSYRYEYEPIRLESDSSVPHYMHSSPPPYSESKNNHYRAFPESQPYNRYSYSTHPYYK